MSSRNERIDQEVQKTLNAFSQVKRLTASPWFAERVRARLHAQAPESPAKVGSFLLHMLRPALLSLIVLLNVVTAVVALQRSVQSSEARETYVNVFASEYAYTTNDLLFTLDEQ